MGQCLIIAGMHRSHTSFFTECFSNAGMYLGQDLLGINEFNAHGHFENNKVIHLHERLMDQYQLRSRYHGIKRGNLERLILDDSYEREGLRILNDLNVGHSVYGWKDPRTCLFLYQWDAILPDAKYVFILRHPSYCVESLMRRSASERSHRFGPILANALYNLWNVYNENILKFAKQHRSRCIVLNSERLSDRKRFSIDINKKLLDDWQLEIKILDLEKNFDPKLVTSQYFTWSVRTVYKFRNDSKRLYEELAEMAL